MGDWFTREIVDQDRLPLFCFFVSFIVAFVLTRINVRLIRANVRFWFKNIEADGLHIHHVVFGIVLMTVGPWQEKYVRHGKGCCWMQA